MAEEVKLTQVQAFGGMRTFKITLPPKNTLPLTTEDLFKLIQFLFDKVIVGDEDSIDIDIDSSPFNVTITAKLGKSLSSRSNRRTARKPR